MSIKSNIADVELLSAAADIGESNCSLEHGPGTKASDYPAVNAMVIPIGRRINEVESEEVRKLSIPICQECVEGLQSDAWVLVYCLNCNENHWIFRAHARNKYAPGCHTMLLQGCQNCTKKFGGIWFDTPNSFANAPSEDM